MASLVLISFSTPLCTPPASLKKMYWERTPLGGLSMKEITVAGTNHLASCSSNRGLFFVNVSCHHHLISSTKHVDGVVACLDWTGSRSNQI